MIYLAADSADSAVSITGIIGLVVAIVTGIVVPIYMYKRSQEKIKQSEQKYENILKEKEAEEKGKSSTTSWDLLTKRLERERDRLSEQLEAADERFAQKLEAAEEKWRRVQDLDRARITELETEVEALHRIIEDQAKRLSGRP